MTDATWRDAVRAEVNGLSRAWIELYRWMPELVEDNEHIDLFVTFHQSDRRYLLRLRYQDDYTEVGRRETFCNPDDPDDIGPEHWPPEGGAFKTAQQAICIPATYGFHHKLHLNDRNHPPETARLGDLLIRMQRVLVPR